MLGALLGLLLLPFKILWAIASIIFGFLGNLFTLIVGLILMVLGFFVSATIIALPIGIILIVFGGVLFIKGLI